MKYFISVKIDLSGNWESFSVPCEIYTYIKQLENYIKNPKQSKLKELYPERFKLKKRVKNTIIKDSTWSFIKALERAKEQTANSKLVFKGKQDESF